MFRPSPKLKKNPS